MEVRLYAGNLARTTTQEQLSTLFTQAGTVNSVDLIKDRQTGEVKGFAFINMASEAEAEKAISTFNGYKLNDLDLKVNVAKARVER